MKHLDQLRFLAACLRAHHSDAKIAAPACLELDSILEIAACQCILPALTPIARLFPAEEDLCEDLGLIADLNLQRNRLALLELEAVLLCCNSLGIEPVLLKGAARIAYASDDILTSRHLGDLDLLVPHDRITQLAEALKLDGYHSVPFDANDHPWLKHYPRLIHPQRAFPVELHRELGEVSWRHVLPANEALADARPAKLGKAKCKLLHARHGVIHAIIHSQVDNRGHWFGGACLKAMDDCISIMEAEGVDWASVHTAFARRGLAAVSRNFESWINYIFHGAGAPAGISVALLGGYLERHVLYPLAWVRWYRDQMLASRVARQRIQQKLMSPQRWLGLSWRIARWFVRLARLRKTSVDDHPLSERFARWPSHS